MKFIDYFFNKIKKDPGNTFIVSKTTKMRGCNIRIRGKNNIVEFKENTSFRNVKIEVRGRGCHLIVGKNSGMGDNTYVSVRENETKLIIGSDCMFSRNSKIMTSDGHNIYQDNKRINKARDIVIGNKVWIADNVTVLKGVNIGSGSILGINSTITKNVPENCIVAGNPARVLRENISWSEELTF